MREKRFRVAQVATADISIRYLLMNQIRAMQKAGFEVTAICADGPHVDSVRKMGCPVDTLPMEREFSPLRDLKALFVMYRYFRRKSCDTVITHTPKAGLLGPVAAQLSGVPLVIHTVHGLLFHDRMPWLKWAFFFLVEWWTARWSDYLFFQSWEDAEKAVRLGLHSKSRIRWIGNGIDLNRFRPPQDEHFRARKRAELGLNVNDWIVGTVGRLVYEKGYHELFEAAKQLFSKWKNVKLLVIGPIEQSQKDHVPAWKISELEATGRVLFLGGREDVEELYPVMDVFALASHREGIPRALMEASAMEIPVVATDIRGCREVVEDGKTGILVPVRDPTALAGAVERLLRRPGEAREMGRAARRRIQAKFDERQVVERLLDLLAVLRRAGTKRQQSATYSDL